MPQTKMYTLHVIFQESWDTALEERKKKYIPDFQTS